MTIGELIKEAHGTAVEKGWWDEGRGFPEVVALIHAEVSEALEEYRNHGFHTYEGEGGKPEGVAIELADVLIRITDYCGHTYIDLQAALEAKLAYNKTRPYRHGNKKA